MELSDMFRIANLVVAGTMISGGISWFFSDFHWYHIIVAVYVILFGLMVALLEFQIPPQLTRYASFLFSFLGRGIFYVFVSGLIFGSSAWPIITGGICCLAGLLYVGLEFVPSIEPPANMREADAGWGAEGV